MFMVLVSITVLVWVRFDFFMSNNQNAENNGKDLCLSDIRDNNTGSHTKVIVSVKFVYGNYVWYTIHCGIARKARSKRSNGMSEITAKNHVPLIFLMRAL